MTVSGDASWPLTGRADELAAAVAAVRRVGPSGVVLAGGAGVGATRLARETVAAVGRPARWVAGSRSARSVAWGALAPLLCGEPSITVAVAALAGPGRVVAVDDAHLLDDASAATVRHVALSGRAAVVLTVRSGRAGPDAVTALWKDGTLPRIDLAPLAADEVRALVEAALGGLVDPLTAARLFTLTRGNPQLLRQVVEDERATGRLAAVEGVWRWRGRFVPSARLDELVATRIEPGTPADERAGLRRLRRAVACRVSAVPTDGEAALLAAVARLDVAAVDQLTVRATGPAAAEARRWVAAVREGCFARPAERGGAVDGRPCAEIVAGTVLSAHGPGRALTGALAAALSGGPLGDWVTQAQAAAARSVGTAWLREDFLGVAALAQRLAGRLDEAPTREIQADLGASAAATRAVTAGLLALDRGLVATAIRDLRAAPVAPGEPWISRCDWAAQRQIGLAYALAMAGDPTAARTALDMAPLHRPVATGDVRASLRGAAAGVGAASFGRFVAPPGGAAPLGVASAGATPHPSAGRPPARTPAAVGPASACGTAAAAGSSACDGGPSIPAWLRPQAALAEAWVAAAEGALSEAIAHARRGAELAAAAGQAAVEVLARHTGVRFGDRAAVDRLAALAAALDTPRAAIAAAHAAALACDDGAGLDAVAVHWAETGALALAADAAAQAALAHRAGGARGSALAAASRADRWAAACPGLRTPALLAAARPLPLTDREREMTMLASAGLSNRAIAERLCVSVRTVEGHIDRACGKLAVPNRAALAAVLTGSAWPA